MGYVFSHWHPHIHSLTHDNRTVNVAHAIDSSLPAGNPSADLSKAKYPLRYDNAKSRSLLGVKYRTMEETARDIIVQFKEKGWL